MHQIFEELFKNFAQPAPLARWEIQTQIHTASGSQWHNIWTDEHGEAQTFDSYEAAAKELREFHAEARLAIEDGDIAHHCPEDYRITVKPKS